MDRANSKVTIGSIESVPFTFDTAGTERMRITSGGQVGIGTPSPSVHTLLHVESNRALVRTANSSWGQFAVANPNDGEVGIVWAASGTGYPGNDSTYTRQWIAGLSPFGTGTDRWSLTNRTLGGNTAITVLDGGNVGINTISPSYKLDVNGTARFGSVIVGSLSTGTVYSNAGTLTNTNPSDQRLKNNINPLSYGLSEILQLNPKSFYYNDNATNLKYGFIAQEVKEVMPELARKLDENSDYLGLETEGIFVTLVNAIKELKQELDTLKNKQ
jgi:hypothetical protein